MGGSRRRVSPKRRLQQRLSCRGAHRRAQSPLTLTPYTAFTGVEARGSKPSYKISASWKPVEPITTYATFATGYRAPVVNAFAGRVSAVNASDIVIPAGASSDDLKSYEVGAKGRWLDGRVTINAAAYLIDWSKHPGAGQPHLGLGAVCDQYRRGAQQGV